MLDSQLTSCLFGGSRVIIVNVVRGIKGKFGTLESERNGVTGNLSRNGQTQIKIYRLVEICWLCFRIIQRLNIFEYLYTGC